MAITVTADGSTTVTVTAPASTSLTVTEKGIKGDKGDQGDTGPQGEQGIQGLPGADGADGADGQGVPTGGVEGQVIVKQSATDYDTAWDYVESVYLQIQNDEGSTLSAGTPVYAKGISGSSVLVGRADANDSAKMPAIGVLLEETTNGSSGEIITAGLFNKTVSGLTGVSVGDTVFVSNTGTLTTTKPTASTDLLQNIGVVLKTNGSNIQKMKVSAIDRTNDIPNLDSGKFFIGGTTGQVSAYTLPTSDGSANTYLKTDGSGAVTFNTIAYSEVSGTPTIPAAPAIEDSSGTPAFATGITKAEVQTLLNVEDGADVTDSVNVTAAGALMDSEVTNLAQVKSFDSSDYATAAQGTTADSALQDVVDDTTPQLGGNLDVNGNKIVSTSNADIDIEPNGTGDVLLGNLKFDADQTVGASQDNYVLTYDNTSGKISLEAATGGSDTHLGNANLTADNNRSYDQNGNDLTIDPNGGTFSVSDSSGAPSAPEIEVGSGTLSLMGLTFPSSDGTSGQAITTNGTGTLSFSTISGGISNVVEDTTPQLGGNLDVNGNKIVSTSNGDIDIEPNGTGDVLLGNFKFDADQTVGSGQDNYVLTYDNSTGKISLEASSGGGGSDTSLSDTDQTLTADRTIDTNGYNLDIELDSSGTADTFTIHDGTHDLFQVDTGTTGTIFSVNDVSGLPKLTVDDSDGVTIDKFKEVKYEKPSNTDFSYQGDVVYFGATTSMTQGDLYYYNSSGNWAQADADAVSSSGSVLLAIALGTASDTDGMLLKGTFTMAAGAIDGTEATGDELYVSTTAGHVTSAAPTAAGDVVRVVGYCLDGTNGQIWFNPSNDWIEL